MGKLIAMAYPTPLFLDQADHTYVKCGTGKKAWSCWGGTTGGKVLGTGTASTRRADKIAQPDEKAGIKCYLINGVCHQAANRILMPAGLTVRGARGYGISEAFFGPYGRVGFWPCKGPLKKYSSVTGDLPECAEGSLMSIIRTGMAASLALKKANKLDWHYTKGVLDNYGKVTKLMRDKVIRPADAKNFHLQNFMYMAEFHLGPMLDRGLSSKLKQVCRKIENERAKAETAFEHDRKAAGEFVDRFNKTTILFQDEMASVMKPDQYETLYDLKPDERVILADRRIVKKVYGVKYGSSDIQQEVRALLQRHSRPRKSARSDIHQEVLALWRRHPKAGKSVRLDVQQQVRALLRRHSQTGKSARTKVRSRVTR